MNKLILTYLFIVLSTCSYGQNHKEKKLQEWIKKNNIIFNAPSMPVGFNHFLNCNEVHAFRKDIGDTIIIYSRGGSVAEDLETLKKSIKDSTFNVYRYPAFTQENGTIVMQDLRKWIFLWVNDTLYLYDDYDFKKDEQFVKIMEAFFNKEISEAKFYRKVEENDKTDYGFISKFKMIYFKGIFQNSKEYWFDQNQNFRKEIVILINTWTEKGKNYFEINLETHTAGHYVLSEDMTFINTEICKK